MEPGSTLHAQCPTCRKRTEHEVLAGRIGGKAFQGTLKCVECATTHPATLRRSPRAQVVVVISRGGASEKRVLEFRADEVIRVGDELFLDEGRVLVASVEIAGERRPPQAKAADIRTLWTKAFDRIEVKVNVVFGERTVPRVWETAPEDEVAVGQVLRWADLEATVFQIKTAEHRLRKGSAMARDVQRAYARAAAVFEPRDEKGRAPRAPPRRARPRRR